MSKLVLTEGEKKARNEYLREWHKRPENIDKRKQYMKKYWHKKAQEIEKEVL